MIIIDTSKLFCATCAHLVNLLTFEISQTKLRLCWIKFIFPHSLLPHLGKLVSSIEFSSSSIFSFSISCGMFFLLFSFPLAFSNLLFLPYNVSSPLISHIYSTTLLHLNLSIILESKFFFESILTSFFSSFSFILEKNFVQFVCCIQTPEEPRKTNYMFSSSLMRKTQFPQCTMSSRRSSYATYLFSSTLECFPFSFFFNVLHASVCTIS